jgi:hypothetical protein
VRSGSGYLAYFTYTIRPDDVRIVGDTHTIRTDDVRGFGPDVIRTDGIRTDGYPSVWTPSVRPKKMGLWQTIETSGGEKWSYLPITRTVEEYMTSSVGWGRPVRRKGNNSHTVMKPSTSQWNHSNDTFRNKIGWTILYIRERERTRVCTWGIEKSLGWGRERLDNHTRSLYVHVYTLSLWKMDWHNGLCRSFFLIIKSNLFGIRSLTFIYYEQQIKRGLKGIHISGCRYNERLKAKTDGSMCLTYTGLCWELEHLKIETRLIGVSFECVMGECVI